MCLDELQKEKLLLEQLIASEVYQQYVADLDEQVKAAQIAIFSSVPQTDGELREREQAMGYRNFAEAQKSWFIDRLTAVNETIADHIAKQHTPDESTTNATS